MISRGSTVVNGLISEITEGSKSESSVSGKVLGNADRSWTGAGLV